MKRHTWSLQVCALAALIAALFLSSTVYAEREIPVTPKLTATHKDVEFGLVALGGAFAPVPFTQVSIATTSPRFLLVQFSAEVRNVAAGGRVDVRYSVNGGACSIFGPEFFSANAGGNFETHTNVSVISVGAGTFTIRPCAREVVNDGFLFFRTLTVEGYTD